MSGRFPFIIALMMVSGSARSQYYYKDIILSRQNQENLKSLREQKAKEVNIVSLDANDEPTRVSSARRKSQLISVLFPRIPNQQIFRNPLLRVITIRLGAS